jgi:hypothetical protein
MKMKAECSFAKLVHFTNLDLHHFMDNFICLKKMLLGWANISIWKDRRFSTIGKIRNKVFFWKLNAMGQIGRPETRWEESIKINLRKIMFVAVSEERVKISVKIRS